MSNKTHIYVLNIVHRTYIKVNKKYLMPKKVKLSEYTD